MQFADLKKIIRIFMLSSNPAPKHYWFDKKLLDDDGRFELTLRFKN